MSLFNKIFGRPLPSSQEKNQTLSVLTGVPAMGLDALSSTAYGPEAALTILLPLGAVGLHYFLPISILVVVVLVILFFSYLQTISAYPNGGGAYIVASDNFGKNIGVWAAVALLLDYLLNVAVGISAGVGAIVSALPELHAYKLVFCLVVLVMLTILNLRGLRESGMIFVGPTVLFVFCIGAALAIGIFYTILSGGNPQPVVAPPEFSGGTVATVSMWLLLSAFANGLTAMTGIEAVSNAVPLFARPAIKNAQLTLTVIVIILSLFLLGVAYLCPAYHVIAMDETIPGYKTMLSQIVSAVSGNGVFYYISMFSVFIILTYSAQTSFAGFPRVCQMLAQDNFLPHFFADKGRRLVFAHGIIILAIFSAVLLVTFGGITFKLIPLFAVGAFSAFLFSQTGMVVHWLRHKDEPHAYLKLFFNALGAVTTIFALGVIIVAKFVEGAWIIVVAAPLLVLLMMQINRRYQKIARQVDRPIKLHTSIKKSPIVIIPIANLNRIAEKAVEFGLTLSDNVTCVNINTQSKDESTEIKKVWNETILKAAKSARCAIPKLEIINSPYRRINKPIVDYIKKVRSKNPDRIIFVVIPELIEPHWYQNFLHNINAAILKTMLFLQRGKKIIVITIPWYITYKN